MEQEILPKTREELKELIIEIVNEVNKDNIPSLLECEEEELEKLHGETLSKPISREDYMLLE